MQLGIHSIILIFVCIGLFRDNGIEAVRKRRDVLDGSQAELEDLKLAERIPSESDDIDDLADRILRYPNLDEQDSNTEDEEETNHGNDD